MTGHRINRRWRGVSSALAFFLPHSVRVGLPGEGQVQARSTPGSENSAKFQCEAPMTLAKSARLGTASVDDGLSLRRILKRRARHWRSAPLGSIARHLHLDRSRLQ
jgi:hypothetical protein